MNDQQQIEYLRPNSAPKTYTDTSHDRACLIVGHLSAEHFGVFVSPADNEDLASICNES